MRQHCIPVNHKDPWGHVSNLKSVKLPWTPTKTISIKTDGVEANVSYSRDELRRPNDNFDKTKKAKKRQREPDQAAGQAPPLPRIGVIKLEDITNAGRLAERLAQSLVHGIDPGVIDVLRVVRESANAINDPTRPLAARKDVNPCDNICVSGASWQKAIMTKYYEKKDLARRDNQEIQPVLAQLSQTGARRSVAEWQAYLDVQFQNIEALTAYQNHKSSRRARRTKKIMRKSTLDRIRNAIFSPGSPMAQMRSINPPSMYYNRPYPLNRPPEIRAEDWTILEHVAKNYQEGPMPPVIAWGSAFFGNRRGRHSLPVKLFQEYLGRFALVILVPERHSSQQSPCGDGQDRRTVPYQVMGRTCNHQKRCVHTGDPLQARSRRRRVYCFDGERRGPLTRISTPGNPHGKHHLCVQNRPQIQLRLVRHRVCPHCRCDHVYFY